MRVLVFGGTHGNEWTGIMTVTKYAESFKQKYPQLEIEFILANPEAYKINRRFKDEDLNRAFQFLNEKRHHSFEHQRAHEIKQLIEQQECFIIDLHTTTSNMGSTLIVSQDQHMNFSIAAKVAKRNPDCRIISSPDPQKKYLGSQSDYGLMIEVGPIANGIVEPVALKRTLNLLDSLLDEISRYSELDKGEVETFEEIQDVYYPKNEKGDISAFIHAELQNQDFKVLEGEFKAFTSFENQDLTIKINERLYPIFINEAAYYPVGLAFILCRKTKKTI